MKSTVSRISVVIGVFLVLFLIVGTWLHLNKNDTAILPLPEGYIELRLGELGSVEAVSITPLEVLEDSRCPVDVQCIWAGTVRLRATLASGLGTADQVFPLGETITTEVEEVTLVEVRPAPRSTVTIKDSEYRFVFKVNKRP